MIVFSLPNQIGSIAPGLQADIIALEGDPLRDINAVRRVVRDERRRVLQERNALIVVSVSVRATALPGFLERRKS